MDNTIYRKPYIKSISCNFTGAILLIYSLNDFSEYTISFFQDDSDLELSGVFIVYVGAPILIVLANIISIAFLSSQRKDIEIQH